MSALLSLLFPSPVVQGLTAAVAAFVTYVVPILYRKAQAAWASFQAAK
jgi:hypothetical protein